MKKINSALISVFYKDGLEPLILALKEQGVQIYSTGGTESFIKNLGVDCIPVETVTGFPSILGGRVKTLHPKMFGGILGRRNLESDVQDMNEYNIPPIDLVIVDLYPFEETVKATQDEKLIIEKIDIGGPSMIRAAAKNHQDIAVLASKEDYAYLLQLIQEQNGATSLEQRRALAAKAFEVAMNYDIAISNFFNGEILQALTPKRSLRYGENPHQAASFYGPLEEMFEQIHGKELSYNNLVDIDAAAQVLVDFKGTDKVFGIIKHTNVCGLAQKETTAAAWQAALAGDPESAFGGVLFTNQKVDAATANMIHELFFEVLIAPEFEPAALTLLQGKKNRILLVQKQALKPAPIFKKILNGTLVQASDNILEQSWNEVCGTVDEITKADLKFANIAVKHLKSNAIALVKNQQLLGKGCGQTSRIDALRQALDKAKQFEQDLSGAVMASDAFFPFDDCVRIADEAGIKAIIQPGGSIRDQDSIQYCSARNIAMVLTETRHFKH